MADSVQIQKVNHRHHAMIDWLLANPQVKNLQVMCDALNLSRSWVSIVMNSDAFRDEFARRRAEMDEDLQTELIRSSFETAIKANYKLQEYLNEPLDKLDPRILLDTASATADRHYGPKGQSSEKEIEREFVIDGGMLVEARERIRERNSGETTQAALTADTKLIDG